MKLPDGGGCLWTPPRGNSDHKLHPEKFVRTCFRTRVRLPPPPPRRRKLPIACGDFFTKVTDTLISLRLLFRKKSHSVHLLACKRARDGSLSLPTFCELRKFKFTCQKGKKYLFHIPNLSHQAEYGASLRSGFCYIQILCPHKK